MRRKGNAGFTLLEALIAVAVLAVGMVAALKAVSLSQQGIIESRGWDETMALAKAKLDEVEAAGANRWSVLNGDYGAQHPGVTWVLDIQPTSMASLSRVTVTVSEGRGPRQNVTVERLSWNR